MAESTKNPELRKTALSGLAEVNDPHALILVAQYLDDPQTREEAAVALVKGSKKFENSHRDDVRGWLHAVLEKSKNDGTKKQATESLNRIGK